MNWLVCTSGDDRGRSQKLSDKPVILGRGTDAALRVVDDRTSRHHCRVYEKDGKMVVEDMGSTNGVKFKGKRYRAQTIRLAVGESFAIGSNVFTYAKSKDILGEAAKEIEDEMSRSQNKMSDAVERTYAEALTDEIRRLKREKKPSLLSRLFGGRK